MTIFEHNETGKRYFIEVLIRDMRYCNNNEFAGVYAYSYNWNGEPITFLSKDFEGACKDFIHDNFTAIFDV